MNIHENATRSLLIPAAGVTLRGNLEVPFEADGLVLFAHGSGSSRFSSRNRQVASALHNFGLGTLLFDLLTEDEEEVDRFTTHLRFDIGLLASRLISVARWVGASEETEHLKLGLFGASTGGAAALVAAADLGDDVRAVVSRGGRPDLAGAALRRVKSPTLLIVGEMDDHVITLNKHALSQMKCERKLEIVPGASHLFEEPGTLEMAAMLAGEWFHEHIAKTPARAVRQESVAGAA
jgi:pimeloyl-ACP methyl ester carboxylesterase